MSWTSSSGADFSEVLTTSTISSTKGDSFCWEINRTSMDLPKSCLRERDLTIAESHSTTEYKSVSSKSNISVWARGSLRASEGVLAKSVRMILYSSSSSDFDERQIPKANWERGEDFKKKDEPRFGLKLLKCYPFVGVCGCKRCSPYIFSLKREWTRGLWYSRRRIYFYLLVLGCISWRELKTLDHSRLLQ